MARLYNESWRRTYRGLLPDALLDAMDQTRSEAWWTGYLERPNHRVWVAADGDGIFALMACRPDGDAPGALLLDSLHVAPEQGRQGLGSALIRQAARLAREGGYGRMTVHVVLGNHRAERLYRSLGARPLMDFIDPQDGAPSRALVWEDLPPLAGANTMQGGGTA